MNMKINDMEDMLKSSVEAEGKEPAEEGDQETMKDLIRIDEEMFPEAQEGDEVEITVKGNIEYNEDGELCVSVSEVVDEADDSEAVLDKKLSDGIKGHSDRLKKRFGSESQGATDEEEY